jgi:hypothetical protein
VLVQIAFCPNPPLLVPGLAGAMGSPLEPVRESCIAAVEDLVTSGLDRVAVLGAAARTAVWSDSAGGSLRSYGVDVSVGGADRVLPLALTVGAYLLDEVGADLPRLYQAVDRAASTKTARRLGAGLGARLDSADGRGRRTGLVVMGDGTAKRTTSAPGYLDMRAEPFDAAVASALSGADATSLLAIDPGLATDLWCDGRAPWQAAAGAVLADAAGAPRGWHGRLRYDAAPLGVGYLVATWTR